MAETFAGQGSESHKTGAAAGAVPEEAAKAKTPDKGTSTDPTMPANPSGPAQPVNPLEHKQPLPTATPPAPQPTY